jgi:putative NIF3 family GTP cyclohydrolase 1 type 2
MANLDDIIKWCDQTLQSAEFKDYAPNGLQIEGKQEVKRIVSAVTASETAIDAAIELGADLLWFIMAISGKANLPDYRNAWQSN